MLANPKITETKTLATKGERTDLVKNGFAVSGSVAGGLVYGLYDIFWESLFQGAWASNVLKNSNKEKAFAIEESIPSRCRGLESGISAISGFGMRVWIVDIDGG